MYTYIHTLIRICLFLKARAALQEIKTALLDRPLYVYVYKFMYVCMYIYRYVWICIPIYVCLWSGARGATGAQDGAVGSGRIYK